MSSDDSSSGQSQYSVNMSSSVHSESPQGSQSEDLASDSNQNLDEEDDQDTSSGSSPASDDPSYSPPHEIEHGITNEEPDSGMVYTLKTISSHHRCIYGCRNSSVVVVPQVAREQATMFRIFIPRGARWCSSHSGEPLNMDEFRISSDDLSRNDYEEYIDLLFRCIKTQGHIRIPTRAGEHDVFLKNLTSLSFEDFADLATYVTAPDPYQSLGAYMFRMRSGQPLDRVATLFDYSKETLRRRIDKVMEDLNTRFKPLHLGFGHLSNEELWQHTTYSSRTLLLNDTQQRNHSKITVWDATYIHIGKSSNIRAQQKTYSTQKKTNLIKPMICVLPDGYIYNIFPINSATENDATIMEKIHQTDDFGEHFVAGDTFVFDKGFRDVADALRRKGYRVFLPAFGDGVTVQLTTEQANDSRM